jgi:signal transduction histidine kinase
MSLPPAPSRPGLADWAWAGACAAALLPITFVELLRAVRSDADTAWAASVVVLYLVLHGVVVVRRRAPFGALLVASGVMLALTAASLPATPTVAVLLPSSATYLVMIFTAAASEHRRADAAALVLGLSGAALMTAVAVAREEPEPSEPGPLIALAGFLVASIAAAWALGRYRRESRRKLAAQELGREQAAELRVQGERAAIAEERRRIGRELHDVISHSLAVMVAQAEASRVLLGRDDDRARRSIEHVVETGRSALADMRGLLAVLAETKTDDDAARAAPDASTGPPERPSPDLRDLPELVERAAGPGRAVDLVERGAPVPVSPGIGLTVYRLVQESLTNTLKHTDPPTRSLVELAWGPRALTVTVTDDGGRPRERRGAEAEPAPEPVPVPGRGIRGMRERVEQAGGLFETGSLAGGGWRATATLPIEPARASDPPTTHDDGSEAAR